MAYLGTYEITILTNADSDIPFTESGGQFDYSDRYRAENWMTDQLVNTFGLPRRLARMYAFTAWDVSRDMEAPYTAVKLGDRVLTITFYRTR